MNNWSKLYKLADRIMALQPWRYMYEDEISGVRDPITGTIGFISVMGTLGEHYSVTVYLGERALGQYLELSEIQEHVMYEMLLEIPMLMLSFEEMEFVEKEDRAIMKEIGITYSGKKLWPLFRSYRPGMVPWFLEEKEMESMVFYLEQFLETAIDPKTEDRAIEMAFDRDNVYLIRELEGDPKNQEWKTTLQKIIIPAKQEVLYTIDPGILAKTKKIPVGKNVYEVDFFLTPAQIREKNKRPFFTYMLLVVDQKSELIISHEMMNPTKGIENMLATIPSILLNSFSESASLPRAVHSGSLRLAGLLSPLFRNLNIPLHYKPHLKSLEIAKSGIMDYFMRK